MLGASVASLSRCVQPQVAASIRANADGNNRAVSAAVLEWTEGDGNHLLAWDDPRYPATLLELPDPPILLFCKGNPALLAARSIAIVGSRNASPAGLQIAEGFAEAFVAAGVNVVSGLALGIDAAAHRGALRAGATGGSTGSPGGPTAHTATGTTTATTATTVSTIAIIGTGIDRVYPPRNRDLAHQIGARGAIMSEFGLETPPLAANFPRRNRLISGLSQGVLVVEAALGSGSLITARMAAEQGREVFAIPGSIHSPFSKGCHKLIKEGAKLVETAADVLEELKWPGGVSERTGSGSSRAAAPVSAVDQPLLDALGYDPLSPDEISVRLGWPIDRVLTSLLQLELGGSLKQSPGGKVQRVI